MDSITNKVYAAIDHAGADGISRTWLAFDADVKAADVDYAIDVLKREGRITAKTVQGRGPAATVYRSTAALDLEAWFQAEIKRRGLDKPRSIRVMGRAS